MKRIKFLSILMALTLVLGACGTNNSANNGGDEGGSGDDGGTTYTVGTDTTYPPFEFEEGGEYKGIDIDLINAIAEEEGFEIELKPMDFGGIIPAILADQLDVAIAGMSITDERKEKVDFSDPYFDAGLTLVVSEDNTDITSEDDLEGKVVAVKNGTTGAEHAEAIKEEAGIKEVRQFNDSPSMFQEVANGNADVLIEDYPVIAYAIKTSGLDLKTVGERLNGDQYGIAVKKGENAELLEKINSGLQKIRDNGTYDEIMNTYLEE
ncbi:transporter substrate-binding domain-containing protein [Rossellomorea vietnamensis]|uniref:Transporter substrate-binding domain-containing protein n=1 Tax=Rossellomorea vietnamensis TaxID=218284 RepID=A0A5D4K7N0_9BACI|nr:transporter substrate-binding domain-containing protein [Rossellomorea vietnamensis]TYR73417.1 transporter substrate-binding domain-containing protein [Rossellomorea vietnamensis]